MFRVALIKRVLARRRALSRLLAKRRRSYGDAAIERIPFVAWRPSAREGARHLLQAAAVGDLPATRMLCEVDLV